jgi:hypothetical protein
VIGRPLPGAAVAEALEDRAGLGGGARRGRGEAQIRGAGLGQPRLEALAGERVARVAGDARPDAEALGGHLRQRQIGEVDRVAEHRQHRRVDRRGGVVDDRVGGGVGIAAAATTAARGGERGQREGTRDERTRDEDTRARQVHRGASEQDCGHVPARRDSRACARARVVIVTASVHPPQIFGGEARASVA